MLGAHMLIRLIDIIHEPHESTRQCVGTLSRYVNNLGYVSLITLGDACRLSQKRGRHMYIRVLAIFFGFLIANYFALAFGQQPSNAPLQGSPVKKDTSALGNSAEQELLMLKAIQADAWAHKESLERQADRHFNIVEKTVDRVTWAYAGIAALLLGVLIWMFGSTRKDLKASLEMWMKKDAQKLIDDASSELRERIDGLRGEVASFLDYRSRKITWICPPSTWKIPAGEERNPKADTNQAVLAALQAAGLHNIQVLNPDAPQAEMDLGDPDLVILSFDSTAEARTILANVVEQLKRRSPPVFLIIDTFSPDAPPRILHPNDFQILQGFLWYVPTNFPSQLVAQTQLLIRRETSVLSRGAHG